jgi:hypothetical protein
MKKKKNKGCIYWDESSRGVSLDRPRGRWVGERLENGKRVRMRSTNYNNVLKWVTGNTTDCPRRQIKGFPDYSIDINRKEVFGKRGTPMKGEVRSNQKIYRLKKDKVTYLISFSRLAYAALNDIDPRKIPADLVVVESNGKYILQNIRDFQVYNNERMRKDKLCRISSILNKRRLEIDILQRYYKTHDTTEIVTYVTKDIFEGTVFKIMNRNHCSMQRATDIVTDAQERFLQRVINGSLPTISINSTILALCNQVVRQSTQQWEYNDNVRYKES